MQDIVHDEAVLLLLHSDALWAEECRRHLPKTDGRVLAPMIGQNVQAYVDDMVVTSQVKDQHVADLEELFTIISKYRLKLNPEKCVFGVEAGKFLGFLLTERGIEVDENQIKEAFINEGRGHSPSHLKFFLLVFSKLKEDIK